MAWPLRLLTVAVVLTAALIGVGTYLRTPHSSTAPAPTPAATRPLADALSSVDTTTLAVQRAPFCDRLAPADLAAALGGPVQHATSYSAGDKATVGDNVTDVVDEYGCRWSAADAEARAWVFAASVTTAWADELAAEVPHGCQALHGVRYGAPTSALRCDGLVRLRGLFGDAWLTCQLQTRNVDLAGRFCLAVARAAE